MHIFLKFAGRPSKALVLDDDLTGLALKEEVIKHLGIPCSYLIFTSQGRPLKESHSIASQGIGEDSTIEVHLKLKGGGCGSSKSASVVDSTKSKESQSKVQVPNFKRGEDPANKPLETIADAVVKNDSDKALGAIEQIEEIEPEDFRNPNLVAAKLIEVICSQEAEGIDQAVRGRLFAYIPNILNIMLQKSNLFTPKTKTSLIETIENALKIVKLDCLGGPELKFHMEMARNMIETFPDSIDIAEVMSIIKDIASFGISLFKMEVPLDETFSLGERVFNWLRGKVRKNAVKSFYELYLTICILSNDNIEDSKAELEMVKLQAFTNQDTIKVGTILLIKKLILKTKNMNSLNKLKDILIPLLSNEDSLLPVVLRICIELNDENFPLKQQFQDWWGPYFAENAMRYKLSKSTLTRMLIDENAASYLQVLNEDRSYLAGISHEVYQKMISIFEGVLEEVKDVYLDLSVAKTKKPNDTLYDLHSKVMEFLDQQAEKVCIAFGDSGSGKSIYCYKLTHYLLTTKSDYLPIYVYLPLYKEEIKGNLVETVLKKYKIGLADDIKSRRILFILDAYDEVQPGNNIIVNNQITETYENSKVLFTCRTNEAPPNLNIFANKDSTGKSERYSVLYVQPLSKDSIEHYARKVVQLNVGWKSFDELWSIINRKEVLQLLSNPFLLGVCLKNPAILNNLNSLHTKINMTRVYQEYINVYQTKEYEKADNQTHDKEEMQDIYTETSIEFAFRILEKGNLSREDISQKEQISRGCLLKETMNKSYSFLHPSIADYFVAAGVIKIANDWNKTKDIKQLNRVELMERYKVLDFIKEMMNECSKEDRINTQEALLSITRLRDPNLGICSSNALSILNYCGKNLHGQDLSGIYAKKANLRYACLINANLNGSDLECANLSNANLYKAQMKCCNLIGVNLGTQYRDMKHDGNITSVALTSDHKFIVSGSYDQTIKVWEFETGVLKYALQANSSWVLSVAISSDNLYIISGHSDNSIKVWELDSGKLVRTIEGHTGPVVSLAITHDDKYIVSGSEDNTVKVWYFKTSEIRHTLERHSLKVTSIAVSRDSKFIVSGTEHNSRVLVWVLETGEYKNSFEAMNTQAVAITSDNQFIVFGGWEGTVHVWELETGILKYNLKGSSSQIRSLAISWDNQIIASGDGDSVIIWDLEIGEIKHTLQGHSEWINALAISSDNQFIVSGSADKTIKVWNLESGDSKQNLQVHLDAVTSVAVSSDNKFLFSGSRDKSIKVWEIETGALKHSLEASYVNCIAISSDCRFIVAGDMLGTIQVWELESQHLKHTLKENQSIISSVAISNDNKLFVSSSGDGTLKVWELNTGLLKYTLEGDSTFVIDVDISTDNRFIVSLSRDKIHVWELNTGNLINTLSDGSKSLICLKLSYDSRYIVSGSRYEEIKVRELATGNLNYTVEGNSDTNDVFCLAVSRSGRYIISASWDGNIKIRDLETGDLKKTIQSYNEYFLTVDLTPDDNYIVTGSANRLVKIWKLQSDQSDCLVWSTYQGLCAFGCEFESSKLSKQLESTLNYYRSNLI